MFTELNIEVRTSRLSLVSPVSFYDRTNSLVLFLTVTFVMSITIVKHFFKECRKPLDLPDCARLRSSEWAELVANSAIAYSNRLTLGLVLKLWNVNSI